MVQEHACTAGLHCVGALCACLVVFWFAVASPLGFFCHPLHPIIPMPADWNELPCAFMTAAQLKW